MESSIRSALPEPSEIYDKKTKISKLLQAKQVYICECSKIYLSFPALYLHVKNKHNTKLTSRIDDEVCKIEQKNGKTYFTFFYSHSCQENKPEQNLNFPKEFKNQQFCLKNQIPHSGSLGNLKDKGFDSFETEKESEKKKSHTNIQDVRNLIQNYLQSPRAAYKDHFSSAKVVLTYFIEYIEKSAQISIQIQKMKNNQPKMLIQSLPLLFNEYISYYLPQNLWSTDGKGVNKNGQVQTMKIFANWLREHNYTNLIVLDNI